MYSKAPNPQLGFVKRLKHATNGDFALFFTKKQNIF
jgi:hypothetical protein